MYERTKENKWSDIIKQRRLRWIGHLHRLPENYPAWKAYEESQRKTSHQKKCKGNKMTWKKQINQDLQNIEKGISTDIKDIRVITSDRDKWRKIIKSMCPVSIR